MKRITINLLLLFMTSSLFAQLSAHLSYSEATKAGIGIGYDLNKRFWGDLTISRWITNNEEWTDPFDQFAYYNLSVDVSIKYNLIAKTYYDIYLGIGTLCTLDYDPEAYFTVPVGIRIRPFKELDKIAFQIELQPAMQTDTNDYLFGKIGIHYRF